jgi:hypothetical protein
MEQFLMGGGLQILVKLRFNSVKDVFVVLPHNYSPCFTTSQIAGINNKTLYIDCILLDYTRECFPVLEFIFAGGAAT